MKREIPTLSVQNTLIGLIVLLTFSIGLGAYGWYDRSLLQDERTQLQADLVALREVLENTKKELTNTQTDREQLAEALSSEQEKLELVGDAFEEIKGTVSVLDKLSKLDPELLQKYSKVYFLNEHYVPEHLRSISTKYLYNESREEQIDSRVKPFLEDLLEDAEEDGIELYVASAYRSFDTQASLKTNYTVTYGSGANAFSADQGYSEHQLGTTVDFLTTGIGGTLAGFDNTEAYTWLLNNAHKYGFTLSYPEGNAYYIFEPWHWRFVGTDLAKDLHRDDEHFYDLSQRTIDEYLINIFD